MSIYSERVFLSEFVLTHKTDDMRFAEVTVTTFTGALWWTKDHMERRKIARQDLNGWAGDWYYVDTGAWCPEQVVALERAWRAQEELKKASM